MNTFTVPQAVVPVPIEDLIVDTDHRRGIDQDRVESLAESIRQGQLLQPITVRRWQFKQGHPVLWKLIAGAHRVEAYTRLGRPHIPAIVLDLDDLHAELAEIDENLVRAPLSAIEEAQAISRRKEIYEELHPETKHGAKKQKTSRKDAETQSTDPLGGLAPLRDATVKDPDVGSLPTPKSFVDDTADKTGQSRSTIAAKAKLGREILPDVAKKIAKTPVADNAKELAKLARLDPDQQRTVAKMLAEGEVDSVTAAIAEPPGPGEDSFNRVANGPRGQRPKTSDRDSAPARSVPPGCTSTVTPGGIAMHDPDAVTVEVQEPQGAGAWLRERIGWLLQKYQTTWKDEATAFLASAVLEQWAAELREGFVAALAQAGDDPYVTPWPDSLDGDTPSETTEGVYHVVPSSASSSSPSRQEETQPAADLSEKRTQTSDSEKPYGWSCVVTYRPRGSLEDETKQIHCKGSSPKAVERQARQMCRYRSHDQLESYTREQWVRVFGSGSENGIRH